MQVSSGPVQTCSGCTSKYASVQITVSVPVLCGLYDNDLCVCVRTCNKKKNPKKKNHKIVPAPYPTEHTLKSTLKPSVQ